jgi:hypothetical protein
LKLWTEQEQDHQDSVNPEKMYFELALGQEQVLELPLVLSE